MAVTTVYTYPLNGTAKDFNIPFEYLARRFVTVTLIGTDRKELALTTDYRFTSKTSVQTTKAWGSADGYELIEIRRNTSATDRLVDFADGSILRAYELNIAQIQTMHIAEEARNMVTDTIGVNNDGDLDARARRIVNLADATEPGHAVTLRQEQEWAQSTLNNRNASAASSAAALVSQNAAKTSETNVKASEVTAKASETNAKASEVAAKASETNAKASEVAAKTSETNAKASEVAAKTSETNAKTSETNAAGYAAGLNMPSASSKGAMLLRQRLDESGLEYVPVVGGVASVGGVSTGSLVEYISEPGRRAWRFAGGLQICESEVPCGPITTAFGSLYRSDTNTFTMARPFIEQPTAWAMDAASALVWLTTRVNADGSGVVVVWYPAAIAGSRTVKVVAAGRWT